MLAIIPYVRPRTLEEIHEDYVAAMWLLFLRCPGHENRDIDGMFDLGTIDNPRSDRGIDRPTPYSPGRVKQ
jgi:hypothetical protein